MVITSAIIFVIVVVIAVAAIVRHRRIDPRDVSLDERGDGWILWGGTVMPVAVLVSVSVVSFGAMRAENRRPPVATIRVTGHQWWWQLDYEVAGARFRGANELHVPVGQPVRLLLTSADVIHSFWVPRLEGKIDVLPGDTNDLRLEVRRAGSYEGACAEFCGLQHAHMAISVVVEDSASFGEWVIRQLADAPPPADSVMTAGQHLFVTTACATCHTVRGTAARSEFGPDLTHVGSRLSIAAGTLPNSLAAVAGWIANPQALKPGAAMPTLDAYTGPELRALAAYVRSLK
jgi:cytochrome c oxidase subunit 2